MKRNVLLLFIPLSMLLLVGCPPRPPPHTPQPFNMEGGESPPFTDP